MNDREKIIKGLECCLANGHNNCPYKSTDEGIDKVTCCTTYLMKDAIALLKAQEPVEPTIGGDADGPCRNWWYQCGKCKEAIDYHDKYCRHCGQAVKW